MKTQKNLKKNAFLCIFRSLNRILRRCRESTYAQENKLKQVLFGFPLDLH